MIFPEAFPHGAGSSSGSHSQDALPLYGHDQDRDAEDET